LGLKLPATGELLSVDVIDGRDALAAAKKILGRKSAEHGMSTWDASGIFFEMNHSEVGDKPSARTLLLLYAADLFFRLRWEIIPALQEGKRVVAVPYIETGFALGTAVGLPNKWLSDVFRFAPLASQSFRVNGAASPKLGTATSGFVEFCSHILNQDLRPQVMAYFDNPKFLTIPDLHHIR